VASAALHRARRPASYSMIAGHGACAGQPSLAWRARHAHCVNITPLTGIVSSDGCRARFSSATSWTRKSSQSG